MMFVVLLTFSENKNLAGELMEEHRAWISKGFEEGVFLVAGSLQPNRGGALVVHNTTREDLEERVSRDPFVAENVVVADIMEISPSRADDRLQFLLG